MTNRFSPDDVPWDALTRYIAGELAEPEAAALERWLAAEPERAKLVEDLRRIWLAAGSGQTWNARAALARIKQRPAGPARVIDLPRFYRGGGRTWTSRLGWRVAALLAFVAGSVGLWRALTRASGAAPGDAIATSEITTPRGQRASLTLPDGTRVLVGPASTLRYAVAPDRGPRTIRLDGSAYFVVTHDAARPFTVETAYGTATDLGTAFDVRAYAADSALVVAVAEGKVALDGGPTLTRGELGRRSARGEVTVRRDVDLRAYLAWTEGRLEFHNAPLREAVAQLGRWYDLDIRLADSALGGRRLTGSFEHEAAPEMLQLVSASLRLRVERHGRTVTLSALRPSRPVGTH